MKIIAGILVLLAATCQAQISYFNQGFLRQPDAATDRAYLGISNAPPPYFTNIIGLAPGTNVTFWTNLGTVYIANAINTNAWYPSNNPAGFIGTNGDHFFFGTNTFLTNTAVKGRLHVGGTNYNTATYAPFYLVVQKPSFLGDMAFFVGPPGLGGGFNNGVTIGSVLNNGTWERLEIRSGDMYLDPQSGALYIYNAGTERAVFDTTGNLNVGRSTTAGTGAGNITSTNSHFIGPNVGPGYFYTATNNGIIAGNVTQPLHAFAALMGYFTNTINGGANTYAIVTNYQTARTNMMTCGLATGVITNVLAGFYYVAIHLSGVAVNAAALIEGDLLLNGAERDEVSFQSQFDPGTPRLKGMSAFGILYIPANTAITFQVKSSGAGGITIHRSQFVVMSP